jgi:hypothetical protein
VSSCEVQRTLVKSPPELWSELSDPPSLARHLSAFGEIRIVGVEAESKVRWEGEGISGEVELKASGWGTKVTLTAVRQPPDPPAPPEPEAHPEPGANPELEADPESEPIAAVEPEPKLGFFARMFRRRRKPEPAPEPEQVVAPEPEQVVTPTEPEPQPDLAAELKALEEAMVSETTAVFTALLDRLGAAHHRPFSRA